MTLTVAEFVRSPNHDVSSDGMRVLMRGPNGATANLVLVVD